MGEAVIFYVLTLKTLRQSTQDFLINTLFKILINDYDESAAWNNL